MSKSETTEFHSDALANAYKQSQADNPKPTLRELIELSKKRKANAKPQTTKIYWALFNHKNFDFKVYLTKKDAHFAHGKSADIRKVMIVEVTCRTEQ